MLKLHPRVDYFGTLFADIEQVNDYCHVAVINRNLKIQISAVILQTDPRRKIKNEY